MDNRLAAKVTTVVGIAVVAATFWGAVGCVPPFYTNTYPLAWYGLIFFLDGLLWWRWGEGLVLRRPREFVTLLFWSAVLWFFFEAWNLRLGNWYYAGVSPDGWWPHIEAYLDFATVLPGMFLMYRLLCRLRLPRLLTTQTFALGPRASKWCLALGAAMLLLPLVRPDWFYPLVWGAFLFLLEPVNAKLGARSLLKEGQAGEWTALVRLLLAGILCGIYWELCNYWAQAKWVYTVPSFSEGKLFEMPYLGFVGFAPFCVECFVMVNTLYLLRGGRHWDPDATRPGAPAPRRVKTLYVFLIVAGLLFSEWSYARMIHQTVDSRAEPLAAVLEDIAPTEAHALTESGWRFPRQILDRWDEALLVIRPAYRSRIRQRLELVKLLQMGSENARLLESAGVLSPNDLARQDVEKLYRDLVQAERVLQLRGASIQKRRVAAWIGAARRETLFR